MNRRTVLSWIASVPLFSMLPFRASAARIDEDLVDTIDGFESWLGRHFECIDGPAGPTIRDRGPAYVSYGLMASDTPLHRTRLIWSMQTTFISKLKQKPWTLGCKLYWRDHPAFEPYVLDEDKWPFDRGDAMVNLRMRVCVPELGIV